MSTAHLGQHGRNRTVNLDRRSKDRLAWSCVAVRHLYGIDASASVIVRHALHLYTAQLEKHLKAPSNEAVTARNISTLKQASKGTENALPSSQIEAIPPIPFSAIERQAAAATRQAFSDWMKSELSTPSKEPE